MRSKTGFILLIQIMLVVVFLGAVVLYTQQEINPTKVYVFGSDNLANAAISKKDLVEITVAKSTLRNSKNIITAKNIDKIFDKKKKITTCKVYAGNIAYTNQITDSQEKDPFASIDLNEYRKVSLSVDYSEAFGGEIARGDYVDLACVTTEKTSNSENAISSDIFMPNVLVYSVTSSDGSLYISKITDKSLDASSRYGSGKIKDSDKASGSLGIVTLLVTPEQGKEILAKKQVPNATIKLLGKFSSNKTNTGNAYTIYE